MLVGDDADEDPVAHPRVADVRLDGGDLHAAPLRPSSSATLSSIRRVDLAASTFVFVIPYAQRYAVLVEDVVERDVGDEVEVLARREVAGVVVRVAERERLREGLRARISRPALVEELERVRDDRSVADRERLELGRDGLVGAARSCRRRTASAERWYSGGKCCAEVAVCTDSSATPPGSSGFGSASSAAIRASSSSSAYGMPPALELEPRRRARRERASPLVSIPASASSTAAPIASPSSSRRS